ncbi:GerMN domain-containing protein [Streptomyces sp. MP131-18]|uniref:GerMN domain-containing protein n=1 Tax=Streptomyces sp. MP131-18 TaxID=1857892 RepID=UPI00097BFE48|nr:GerMN domain-containing protein [Streptomyces sp. MP131-18]ONK11698.1 hypothetical protein STBA_24340 [Streptomyces sp. MP131-18]
MRDKHATGRTARHRSGLPVLASALLTAAAALAGCGVSDTGPVAAGAPAAGGLTVEGSELLRVYFVTPQGAWPATRPAPADAGPQQALNALLGGPTAAERARGLDTALPAGSHEVSARASPGTVDLYLPWLVAELDSVAVSQLVCTAAAAPGVPGANAPVDVVVRVHESGLAADPWEVMCDETGTAAPRGRTASR